MSSALANSVNNNVWRNLVLAAGGGSLIGWGLRSYMERDKCRKRDDDTRALMAHMERALQEKGVDVAKLKEEARKKS
jgi:hypothetical protein